MSDDKAKAFDRAFEQTDVAGYERVRVDQSLHTFGYLMALVSRDEEIASFTVAEIIEHLHRHL